MFKNALSGRRMKRTNAILSIKTLTYLSVLKHNVSNNRTAVCDKKIRAKRIKRKNMTPLSFPQNRIVFSRRKIKQSCQHVENVFLLFIFTL